MGLIRDSSRLLKSKQEQKKEEEDDDRILPRPRGADRSGFLGNLKKNLLYLMVPAAAALFYFGDQAMDSLQADRAYTEAEKRGIAQEQIPGELEQDREELEEDVLDMLNQVGHTYRAGDISYVEAFTDDERVDTQDLNKVKYFLEGLQDQETVDSLGELVAKDLAKEKVELDGITRDGEEGSFTANTAQTEIGGLVKGTDDGLVFQPYEPVIEKGDGFYDGTVHRKEDRALAAFHLHVAENNPLFYAGPSESEVQGDRGTGDLGWAQAYNRTGLVVTYLGEEDDRIELNVDYYNAHGSVIDLGNYTADVSLDD